MNILNHQIFAKIKTRHSLIALAIKASTQHRDWQKDDFKMFRNLLHSVLRTLRNKFLFLLMFVSQSVFTQTTFYFAGKAIDPGTKEHFMIPITAGNDATFIPISVFNGIKDGPVLGITAGVHGYEYPPIMASQKLIHSIKAERLSGLVILVQIANLEGFKGRTPYLNPLDGKNLNRAFPGSTEGSITEKIANYITEQVIAKSDFFLDMHSGDAPEDLMSYAAYYNNSSMPEASKKGQEMAAALNFDHIIVFETDGKDYMKKDQASLYCSAEAFKRNIPSVDIECGRLGIADPLLSDKVESGVINLLEYLEMLPASGPKEDQGPVITINKRFYISAPVDGIFYSEKNSGEYVSKGMKIGHITNYFGEPIKNIYASEDGILLIIMKTPPINKGETIAVIGKVN